MSSASRFLDAPLFSCDQAVDSPEIFGVYTDHLQSTLEGLDHLYRHGCRTTACVYAPKEIAVPRVMGVLTATGRLRDTSRHNGNNPGDKET